MPRPAVSDNKAAWAAVEALLIVQASGSFFAAAPGWCIGHDSLGWSPGHVQIVTSVSACPAAASRTGATANDAH